MLNEQSLVRAFKTLIVDKLAKIVDLIVVGSTLEPATATKLGGVKIGNGVNIAEDGTISVNALGPWTKIKGITTAGIDIPVNFKEVKVIYTNAGTQNDCVLLSSAIFTPEMFNDMITETGFDNLYIGCTGRKTDGTDVKMAFTISKTTNGFMVKRPSNLYNGSSSTTAETNRCYLYYR